MISWELKYYKDLSTDLARVLAIVLARVLARDEGGFNVQAVESLLEKGDESSARGDLAAAKKQYDQARDIAKKLLSFYRDLSGSFRGLDARIPREMDANSRKVLALISKANLKLATLFRKNNQSALAVPLLVEVVRISGPAKKEGNQAYKELVELGFVNTPFRGGRKRS